MMTADTGNLEMVASATIKRNEECMDGIYLVKHRRMKNGWGALIASDGFCTVLALPDFVRHETAQWWFSSLIDLASNMSAPIPLQDRPLLYLMGLLEDAQLTILDAIKNKESEDAANPS